MHKNSLVRPASAVLAFGFALIAMPHPASATGLIDAIGTNAATILVDNALTPNDFGIDDDAQGDEDRSNATSVAGPIDSPPVVDDVIRSIAYDYPVDPTDVADEEDDRDDEAPAYVGERGDNRIPADVPIVRNVLPQIEVPVLNRSSSDEGANGDEGEQHDD